MTLTILYGNRHAVNHMVLWSATQQLPTLIIDGANYADPHRILSFGDAEVCDEIFVLETELIYKLRDAVSDLAQHALTAKTKRVCFTTFDALFNYQDAVENNAVFSQVWLLLRRAAIKYDIIVGVRAGSTQEQLAINYARGATWVTLS